MLLLILRRKLDLAQFSLHIRVLNLRALDISKNLLGLVISAFGDEPAWGFR